MGGTMTALVVVSSCKLCNKSPAEYKGYCLNCAELVDLIVQARKKMKRWLNIRKPCGCNSCVNQEQRDKDNLDELIALGVEAKTNGW